MSISGQQLIERAESLYVLYGKPLEKEHWGEYVAIFPDGRWVLGSRPRGGVGPGAGSVRRRQFCF